MAMDDAQGRLLMVVALVGESWLMMANDMINGDVENSELRSINKLLISRSVLDNDG